jgi:hypothetical protein
MSHAKITIPIIAEFSWRPGYFEEVSGLKAMFPDLKWLGSVDPWLLRKAFLSCPLDKWEDVVAASGGARRFSSFPISREVFERWQKLLREVLIRPAQRWRELGGEFDIRNPYSHLSAQPAIRFEWSGDSPQVFVLPKTALEAMIATIQIDKLRGAEFRVCARHDCKEPPFLAKPRQKKFCSMACAHLFAVRENRKREAAAKSKVTRKVSGGRRQAKGGSK